MRIVYFVLVIGRGFHYASIDSASENLLEREADRFALDAFISKDEWLEIEHLHYADDIKAAAKRLKIDHAIIAGRLRREAGDYRKHRTLIGQGKVRKLFHGQFA